MEQFLNQISKEMASAFEAAGYDGALGRVTVSNRPDLCEYQCNGAMAGAKRYRKAPFMIAEDVAKALAEKNEGAGSFVFSKAEVVKPGFLNLDVQESFLKAYLNVNEVIAGIMLNWISLYSVNMLLTNVKESSTTYTLALRTNAPQGLIPGMGLKALFSNNKYVTIAIPLAVLFAILVWVVMEKTKLGFELKATGLNKNAAKYAGMKEKQNIILTMVVSGCIAGLGAAFLYLSGIEQWSCAQTSVPAMGFNGIAAAFLGGLNPIGCIFSAFFIQHITSGGSYVDKMIYSSQISDLIAAIIIYSCGFVMFFKHCISSGIIKTKKGGTK